MGNVLIPSIIAILIVLTPWWQRHGAKTGNSRLHLVGLAPTHVAFLFIAEALAFGIISSVMGYLAAQIRRPFPGRNLDVGRVTANYSSLAGVGAMNTVMVVVLLSVIYPSRWRRA